MKEIEDIISAYDQAIALGRKTALATVVHVDGSSYRRPGARMLIDENGNLTGAISGGCLEGDALRKSLLAIHEQLTMLVTYDTSDEEDAVVGLQLGCNGIIQVLIEPIDATITSNPIALLKQIAGTRQQAVLLTLFNLNNRRGLQPGTSLLVSADGSYTGDHTYVQEILEPAGEALRQQQSFFRHYTSNGFHLTAFIEFIPPPISLVIFGAGNDIVPLVQMADLLGWKTTVVDGRPAYAGKERFPVSCSVLLAKPEQAIGQVMLDDRTAILLMTHNYHYDCSMLGYLQGKAVRYIGVLGAKKKFDRMLSELREKGIVFSPEQLSRMHSPVGLAIGAETEEEIALSILAEIKTVFASASGAPLKDFTAPIHERSALTIVPMNNSIL